MILILIVVEDGLVPKFNPADADQFFVLILIVVDDDLVHLLVLVLLSWLR